MEYDNIQRLTKQSYSDGSYVRYDYDGNSPNVEYRYGYKGNVNESYIKTSLDNKDRPIAVYCNEAGGNTYLETNYSYDGEGKVITETSKLTGAGNNTINYTYDSEGRIVLKEYPSEAGLGTVSYEYDSNGRNTKISNEGGVIREYTYDGLDRVKNIKNYDKLGSTFFVITLYLYDSHGRVMSMVYSNDGVSGNILESFGYSYDKNSQILSYNHINNMPQDGKKINETKQYAYDDMGNLQTSTKTDHLDSDNQETTEYKYDAVGNRTQMSVGKSVTSYEYNGLNQLISMSKGNEDVSYTYDARGNQVLEEKAENGTVKETVATEYAATGEMTKLTKTAAG